MKDFMILHGADAPSGDNLEYESAFAALEEAARPAEDRQMGDAVIAGEAADPRAVVAAAAEVLSRSHDLRAAVLATPAKIEIDGFAGLAEATGYVRWCLEEHWDTCHPQPDEDDGDLTMRVNAVLGLADPATTLRALRRAPLTRSNAFGRATLRDVELVEGEAQPREGESPAFDAASLSAAFRDTPGDALDAIRAGIAAAREDVKAIDRVFDERAPGEGPDLAPLLRLLAKAAQRIPGSGGGETGEAPPGDDAAPQRPGAAAARPAPAVPGAIASPADVSAALGRIIEYYARHEPSSPIPVLLERARRLVGADFLAIVRDMAPDGMDNVRLVGGLRQEDDEE